MQLGFDNEKYVQMQSTHIKERIAQFGGKLYLEFGGKLFDDFHASRVLPGFLPDAKLSMLLTMKDQAEIVIAINSADIQNNKQRSDLGISYNADVLRLIDSFRDAGLYVGSVVFTRYNEESASKTLKDHLESVGINVYKHYTIERYPADIELVVSDDGYGKNEYIETSRPLVVVTAPGPGSGKMAVCLSQLYHHYKNKELAGYAKFETFPVWNLPLSHPVNLAYESATADLNDVNMIDPFHLEAYGEAAVNYNRDVEIFPVLRTIFERIEGESPYQSPTDMGVNMAGFCIYDDDAVKKAAKREILRRAYAARCAHTKGKGGADESNKTELILQTAGVSDEILPVINEARSRADELGKPVLALSLPDGTIVTGKSGELLGASAAVILNALKKLGGIQKKLSLISPIVIEPIMNLKTTHLGSRNPLLHSDEILLALSICAATNPAASHALEQLPKLRGMTAHASVILSAVDLKIFRSLGVHITCEPVYESNRLYHK